ncbi:MAG: hypothetical protein ACRDKW_00565 [Actinomycetota bacterium]
MRRRFWMLLLAALMAGGLACSKGGSSTSPETGAPGDTATTGQSGQPAGTDEAPATTGGSEEVAKAQKAKPGEPGQNCKECQSSNNAVTRSDADGFEFQTGEAEASRIEAGDPKPGDEKPSTFDAGEGMTGTTGSGNWQPKG